MNGSRALVAVLPLPAAATKTLPRAMQDVQ